MTWSFDLCYQPVGQATGRDCLPALSRAAVQTRVRKSVTGAAGQTCGGRPARTSPPTPAPRSPSAGLAPRPNVRSCQSSAWADGDLPGALGGDVQVVVAGLQVGDIALIAGTRCWHADQLHQIGH